MTEHQLTVLKLVAERPGIKKSAIPFGYKSRQRGAWWRNFDQLETHGLVFSLRRGGYFVTHKGRAALSDAEGER